MRKQRMHFYLNKNTLIRAKIFNLCSKHILPPNYRKININPIIFKNSYVSQAADKRYLFALILFTGCHTSSYMTLLLVLFQNLFNPFIKLRIIITKPFRNIFMYGRHILERLNLNQAHQINANIFLHYHLYPLRFFELFS